MIRPALSFLIFAAAACEPPAATSAAEQALAGGYELPPCTLLNDRPLALPAAEVAICDRYQLVLEATRAEIEESNRPAAEADAFLVLLFGALAEELAAARAGVTP